MIYLKNSFGLIFFFLPFPARAQEWPQNSQKSTNGNPRVFMLLRCLSVSCSPPNPGSPTEHERFSAGHARQGPSAGRETVTETVIEKRETDTR